MRKGHAGSGAQVIPLVRADEPDELVHTYCCTPNLALCGVDLEGGEDTDATRECVVCEDLFQADAPCPARFCRLRRWLWSWWPW